MEALGRYILSVTSAAILFGILQALLDKKSSGSVLLQFIGGLFLMFTAIAPITDLSFDVLLETPLDYAQEAETITEQGHQVAVTQQRNIIKEQCEAYILDKAICYQAHPEVEITLGEGELPLPTHVRLKGSISPYAKKVLEEWIEDEMGISKENQLWIG